MNNSLKIPKFKVNQLQPLEQLQTTSNLNSTSSSLLTNSFPQSTIENNKINFDFVKQNFELVEIPNSNRNELIEEEQENDNLNVENNENELNASEKQLPIIAFQPDQSIALAFKFQKQRQNQRQNNTEEEETDYEFENRPQNSFTVYLGNMNGFISLSSQLFFFSILFFDLSFLAYFTFEIFKNYQEKLAIVLICFVIATIASFFAVFGIKCKQIGMLSIFLILTFTRLFIQMLQPATYAQFLEFFICLITLISAGIIRANIIGEWFASSSS
eukprot:TRINITY_DN2386_c0_g1_i1.p1 TRINITY_DN2386_c0_g1~~TRINITY_DN2386_c0_g1_i1.p1  ORF type:complete len:272 (+),score=105.62 TRINITY_DN2386_c0_g1_i1:54-869(+)